MCYTPYTIKFDPPRIMEGELVEAFPADCGKCLPCLRKRKSQWSFRLMEEKRVSFSSYFVTLTYDDKHIKYGSAGMTGDKQDHKDFIKWLKYYEDPDKEFSMISQEQLERKKLNIDESGRELKYYGIIEYGDQFGRPHLHYLLFNLRDKHNISRAWSDQMRIAKGMYLPNGSKGKVDVDPDVNVNNVDYVLKYMMKVARNENEFDGREKELQFISKGLGLSFINDETLKYIKREDGNQVINQRGIKVALPRYYNKKFLSEEEREQKAEYAAEISRKEKIKEDIKFERNGKDPAQGRREIAEYQYDLMKQRRRRELK